MNAGPFIVFEGIDGCGKSTQLALLATALHKAGQRVVTTAEPWSGSPWGERIRAMARSGELLDPEEELTWFWRQRRDHVRERIAPALAAGKTVLCDRYYLSSVAYQGARGLDPAGILRESEREFPAPDLVLLFELEVGEALARAGKRAAPDEPVFERADFLAVAVEIFESLELPYLERVPAEGEPEGVHRRVLERLTSRGLVG